MPSPALLTGFADPALYWSAGSPPAGCERSPDSLLLRPTAGQDFWSRTFYSPLLRKADGNALLARVPASAEATLCAAFTLSPRAQFDQAGVLVRLSDEVWVKAGIEFVDGGARLSCVVTNGWSDWSTAPWSGHDAVGRTASIRLRVHKLLPGEEQGPCLVFEAAPYCEGDGPDARPASFAFVRIASLRGGSDWEMGVFGFCPVAQRGCSVRFHYLRLGPKLSIGHEADPLAAVSGAEVPANPPVPSLSAAAAAPLLEVCCDSVESVVRARRGGAARVELCSALAEGGLTPSLGLIRAAVHAAGREVPVMVLVRPRGGDFCFSAEEHALMLSDVAAAAQAGAAGVVLGSLTPEGEVDVCATGELVRAARALSLGVTFHRAIDMCRDPLAAALKCAELGVERVLSSGGAPSAAEGVDTLREMARLLAPRGVAVMAGGGLSAANACAIVRGAGVSEVHGSLRSSEACRTRHRSARAVTMGSGSSEYSTMVCDEAKVVATVAALRGLA